MQTTPVWCRFKEDPSISTSTMSLWSEMRRLQRDMDSLFGEVRDAQQPTANDKAVATTSTNPWSLADVARMTRQWTPLCDVRETENALLVHAELPGINKEDIHVDVENGRLTIRGERKHETKEENEKYHRVERSYGTFQRTMSLPQGVDPTAIEANYKDGVLELTIPKPEPPKGHKITIN
ncbi:Heat shock 70 kDa protein 1A [Balamuthia mandrillaris]